MRVQQWGQTHEHRRHFLRSCLLRIAATVPIDAVLPATSAANRQRRSKYNDISMTSSALWPLQVKGPNKRESAQAQTSEAGRIFLLRVPQGRRFLDNRDTTTNTHTHTHTGVSISVLYMCVAKTSRVLLLFIYQQTRERAEMKCERTHPSLGEEVQNGAVTWQSRAASHRSAISSDTTRQSLDWRVTND